MKNFRVYLMAAVLMGGLTSIHAQTLQKEVFSFLDYDNPNLKSVKNAIDSARWEDAANRLLDYYRKRTNVINPDVDLNHVKVSQEEKKWADDALEHTFFVHYGYQPSFNYGKDINWQYWPVQDNELRWQLHRHKWFTPMGKVYYTTKDEKYAKEWTYQYVDWIRKNPLVDIPKEEFEPVSAGVVKGDAENVRFAWRPLEVSNRLQDQTRQFLLFLNSKSFTGDFLTEFLLNYHRHAIYLSKNYSSQGNHLLFEAQRMIYAGVLFPEFKEAASWRKEGIDILNREIMKQVYADGGHYELDPHYHLACINIFIKALKIADVNGLRNEFPSEYVRTIRKMISFYYNICFPDYTNPCFSDAKLGEKKEELAYYAEWAKIYPKNQEIKWFATEGKQGTVPATLSHASRKSGFFTFRNGWDMTSTVMVVKSGPKGEWHCQPDNGTFELWFNGKNLFPDSGSYVYAGDSEVMKLRNWFRRTASHNTLTLNENTLEKTESKMRLWNGEGNEQVLVTENPSYKGLKHRRTVFFVDNAYFVIVDEAVGKAKGVVNLNYQLAEGKVKIDAKNSRLVSNYEGSSNVVLQCFSDHKMNVSQKEGWRSTAYRKRVERTAVSFDVDKTTDEAVRYITIVYPTVDTGKAPKMKARFINKEYDPMGLCVEVSLNGKKHTLKTDLNKKVTNNSK